MGYKLKKMGAISDRIGIMLKDDRTTIGRRMLSEIILIPDLKRLPPIAHAVEDPKKQGK
jgi:hypothetical protein